MTATASQPLSIHKPGDNCWTTGHASHVSVLIDYANYYHALYQSVLKAKRSIFVLGWDIDSRIEMLRGEDAKNANGLITFFDIICKKAHENPDLQIYLNKWNYSYFFMQQREPFWVSRWKECDLPNIHVIMDGQIPMGACHHQKVVVIDDEIAFWGGMDVALGRWDKRQHHTRNPHRADPGGMLDTHKKHNFGPYHDIQAVVAGPIVQKYADLVRERWNLASDDEAIPVLPYNVEGLPEQWPQKFPPQFKDVELAIARTIPPMKGRKGIYEVSRVFLDEIAQAENFIYMENQYLACDEIAEALNKRLREKPELRLLAVSCHRAQGTMEKKSMWGGRIKFWDILKKGNVEDRAVLAYPASCENGEEEAVHIHSKLMVIDNKFFHLGSSNIANRSMGMDTEFDVTIMGNNDASRKKIEAIRNDLIREHSGREISDIQNIIESGQPVTTFLEDIETSRQHFRRVNDDIYRDEKFIGLARLIGDPKHPFIRASWTSGLFHYRWKQHMSARPVVTTMILLSIIAAFSLIWIYTPLSDYANVQGATAILEYLKSSHVASLLATGLYMIGSLCFFPITVMTAAMVIVFGPLKGVLISFAGALLGALLGYGVGRLVGQKRMEHAFGKKAAKLLTKIKGAGIIGTALIRVVPIAPYPVVNMVFGVSGISMLQFMLGTFIGLAPGKLALALAGDGLTKILHHPSPENIFYLAIGLATWIGVMVGSHKLAKHFQSRDKQQIPAADLQAASCN